MQRFRSFMPCLQSVDVWKPAMYFCSLQHEVPRTIILSWSTMRLWYSCTSYCLLLQQPHAYNIQRAINQWPWALNGLLNCTLPVMDCVCCLGCFTPPQHKGTVQWQHQWKWYRIEAAPGKMVLKHLSQLFHTDYESFTWAVLSELQGQRQVHRLRLSIPDLMFGTGVTSWGTAHGSQMPPWSSMTALISRN